MSAGRVLVVDDAPPAPQRDGASYRMVGLLECLGELGWHRTFAYTGEERGWHAPLPCEGALAGDGALLAYLGAAGAELDAVILSRPHVAAELAPAVRRHAPRALLVYDTVDLYFLREYREARLNRSSGQLKNALVRRRQELGLVGAVDRTLVVSSVERELLLAEHPGASVHVVSNIHPVSPDQAAFEERHGFIFLGNFAHSPNRDGVAFLLSEVWPLVRAGDADASLLIVGADPPAELTSLAADGASFTGHVPDLEPLLAGARVMTAPLRFGAGVKGKVLLAMAGGLPVAGTPLALEGIGDGSEALTAADAPGLAEAMLRLHSERALWQDLRDRGLALVERDFSPAAASRALTEALAPAHAGTARVS